MVYYKVEMRNRMKNLYLNSAYMASPDLIENYIECKIKGYSQSNPSMVVEPPEIIITERDQKDIGDKVMVYLGNNSYRFIDLTKENSTEQMCGAV